MKAIALAAVMMFGAAMAAQQEPVYKAGEQGVKNPEVVLEKKPSYTAAAMHKKIQGSVVLESIVDKEGRPTDIKVVKSLDKENGLDERAVEALKEWRFKPAMKEGKPVQVLVSVEMTFALRDKK